MDLLSFNILKPGNQKRDILKFLFIGFGMDILIYDSELSSLNINKKDIKFNTRVRVG